MDRRFPSIHTVYGWGPVVPPSWEGPFMDRRFPSIHTVSSSPFISHRYFAFRLIDIFVVFIATIRSFLSRVGLRSSHTGARVLGTRFDPTVASSSQEEEERKVRARMSTLASTAQQAPATPTSVGRKSVHDVVHECLAQGNRARLVRLAFEEHRLESVVEALRHASASRGEDIRGICEEHSETFFKWIADLNSMREEAKSIRAFVAQGNQELQTNGKKLLTILLQLQKLNTGWNKAESYRSILKKCLQVTELCVKANTLVEAGQLLEAANVLQKAEGKCRDGLPSKSFTLFMEKEMCRCKESIQGAVMQRFNQWLSSIRSQGKEIGYSVLQQASEEQKERDQYCEKYKNLSRALQDNRQFTERLGELVLKNTKFGESLQKRIKGSTSHSQSNTKSLVPYEVLSQAQLSWHLHSMLDKKVELKKYYRENRKLQLYSDLNILESQPFLDVYQAYFKQLLGFFAIEKRMHRVLPELVPEDDVSSLWELASTSTSRIVKAESQKLDDPSVLLLIHDYFKLVMTGFANLEIKSGAFDSMFKALRERYYMLLSHNIDSKLQGILQNVHSAKKLQITKDDPEWKEVKRMGLNFKVETSWGAIEYQENVKLPWTASFSPRVMEILHLSYSFVEDFMFFLSSFQLHDLHQLLRRYRNRLVMEVLVKRMEEHLQHCQSTSADFQAGLLASDAHALACSMGALDQHIEQLCTGNNYQVVLSTDRTNSGNPLLQLEGQAQGVFAQTFLRQLEQMVDSMVKQVNWSPPILPESASVQAVNIATSISSKFDLMRDFLPAPARQQLSVTAFRKMGQALLGVFTSKDVKKINTYGLITLHQDVLFLRELAGNTLGDAAAEGMNGPKQMLELVLYRATDLVGFATGQISYEECFACVNPTPILSLARKFDDQKVGARFAKAQQSTFSSLCQGHMLERLITALDEYEAMEEKKLGQNTD
eukprot:scaffold80_cov325-Pavlova_lutheri.AAC.1